MNLFGGVGGSLLASLDDWRWYEHHSGIWNIQSLLGKLGLSFIQLIISGKQRCNGSRNACYQQDKCRLSNNESQPWEFINFLFVLFIDKEWCERRDQCCIFIHSNVREKATGKNAWDILKGIRRLFTCCNQRGKWMWNDQLEQVKGDHHLQWWENELLRKISKRNCVKFRHWHIAFLLFRLTVGISHQLLGSYILQVINAIPTAAQLLPPPIPPPKKKKKLFPGGKILKKRKKKSRELVLCSYKWVIQTRGRSGIRNHYSATFKNKIQFSPFASNFTRWTPSFQTEAAFSVRLLIVASEISKRGKGIFWRLKIHTCENIAVIDLQSSCGE